MKGLVRNLKPPVSLDQNAAVQNAVQNAQPIASQVVVEYGLEASDKQNLISLNKHILEGDFQLPIQNTDTPTQQGPLGLNDAKIIIFKTTLVNMSSIVVEQLVLIFLIRALSSSSYEGYMAAMFRTITERTWVKYAGRLRGLAEEGIHHAVNAVWVFL